MNPETVQVNEARMTEVIKRCLAAREKEKLIFRDRPRPPEEDYIQLLKSVGTSLGDNRFALNALFLTTMLVRGDSTRNLFKRISDSYKLTRDSWIFRPKIVTTQDPDEVIASCYQFFHPGSFSGQAIDNSWIYNCKLLNQKYGGDIRIFFEEHGFSAIKIVKALHYKARAKTEEKKKHHAFWGFGPKLALLYIQWVNQYLHPLEDADKIGPPVDFQLSRVFIQTGAVRLETPITAYELTNRILHPSLTRLCEKHNWHPRMVSETIWEVGNLACGRHKHTLCPVEDMCTSLISYKPYDRDGVLDPTDTGRFAKPQLNFFRQLNSS